MGSTAPGKPGPGPERKDRDDTAAYSGCPFLAGRGFVRFPPGKDRFGETKGCDPLRNRIGDPGACFDSSNRKGRQVERGPGGDARGHTKPEAPGRRFPVLRRPGVGRCGERSARDRGPQGPGIRFLRPGGPELPVRRQILGGNPGGPGDPHGAGNEVHVRGRAPFRPGRRKRGVRGPYGPFRLRANAGFLEAGRNTGAGGDKGAGGRGPSRCHT